MTIQLELPQELYEQAARIAAEQHLSVEGVLAVAAADHIAAWQHLQSRARRGDREKFLAVLDTAPNAPAQVPSEVD
ncbi:MAG: hypothetical protein NW208_05295 [Bryobacter sp.]|nr:hypothetical protein [Bryobacter sp.]